MSKRRLNGEGSIYKNNQLGKWVYAYSENGSRKAIYANSKAEILKKKEDFLTGKFVPATNITLYNLIFEYVENKHNLGLTNDNSYVTDCDTLRRLSNFELLQKKVAKIQTEDISECLSQMRDWSQSVIKKNFSLMKNGFELAVSKRIIQLNPMNSFTISLPRSKQKDEKVRAFTLDEQERFCECIDLLKDNYKYKYVWLLSLYSGMRVGEILALSINSIDLKNGIIKVTRTLTKNKDKKVVLGDTTKTYASERNLRITPILSTIVKKIVENYVPNKNELAFSRGNGELLTVSMSNDAFKRFCEKHNIINTPPFNQHMLRHTYATRCIEAGMPAHILRKQLGHKEISTTIDTYTDIFDIYESTYDSTVEEYYQNNNLLIDKMVDPDFIIQKDIQNITTCINNSHLNPKIKSKLLEDIQLIEQIYKFAL